MVTRHGIERVIDETDSPVDLSDEEGTEREIRSMDAMMGADREPPSSDDGG